MNVKSAAEVAKPAFEIIAANGHVYAIWADGRIDGFEDGATVINRIPVLTAKAAEEAIR